MPDGTRSKVNAFLRIDTPTPSRECHVAEQPHLLRGDKGIPPSTTGNLYPYWAGCRSLGCRAVKAGCGPVAHTRENVDHRDHSGRVSERLYIDLSSLSHLGSVLFLVFSCILYVVSALELRHSASLFGAFCRSYP